MSLSAKAQGWINDVAAKADAFAASDATVYLICGLTDEAAEEVRAELDRQGMPLKEYHGFLCLAKPEPEGGLLGGGVIAGGEGEPAPVAEETVFDPSNTVPVIDVSGESPAVKAVARLLASEGKCTVKE